MEYTKSQIQTLIRGGDCAVRLQKNKHRVGFSFIVIGGAFQHRFLYCRLCDKVLSTGFRKSNNVARHIQTAQHRHNRVRQSTTRGRLGRRPHVLSSEDSDLSDNDTTENPIEQHPSISEDGEADSDVCSKEGACVPTQQNALGIKGVYPTVNQNEIT